MSEKIFATIEDLEARWRGLSEGEQKRASVLLEDASSLIRDQVANWDKASEASLRRVACAVVKRAMNTPSQAEDAAVSSLQVTAGPYSQQFSYANPGGDLYLTRAEKIALGGGRSRAVMIDLTPANVGAWFSGQAIAQAASTVRSSGK